MPIFSSFVSFLFSFFEMMVIFTLLLGRVFHLFIYFISLLKKILFFGGGGLCEADVRVRTTWERSQGEGVPKF